jgi:quercetin dioxygenase-like cupin family protein
MTSEQTPQKPDGGLAPAQAHHLGELVKIVEGSIVSRTLQKNASGTVTLFAFAAGQELSEHTAPFDAHLLAVEGQVQVMIGGKEVTVEAERIVLMPANIPHAVRAPRSCKFLLIMLRSA